jgi:hypothetical protein
MADTPLDDAPTYEVKSFESTMTGLPEHDVWKHDTHGGSKLVASYAWKHQAREVAAVLNKWATAEV